MSAMQQRIASGRVAAAKVAAAYAGYRAGMKTARMLADSVCSTWSLDGDYNSDIHSAAVALINEHVVTLPGVPTATIEQYRGDSGNRLSLKDWTFMSVPGIPFLQVKGFGSSAIFRALRKSDLDTLRKMVVERVEEDCDSLEFNTDDMPDWGMPQTQLLTWSTSMSGWDNRKLRAPRSFRSVFLPTDLQHEIEEDLKRFTASRDRLLRLELPWRRGHLFAGPPGTGKTSLSLAIAGSLNFSLASLSLTDITSDGMLREAVSKLRPRTVLVIEDIDAYSVSRDRDHNTATDGKLSLSGLLNSLDGFETPDGLVTIATSNHADKLDPALVRSGRLDRTFTLDYIAARELERLHAWFYEGVEGVAPMSAPETTFDARMAPAQVAELFKQHLNDPQGGWDAVTTLAHEATRFAERVA